MNLTFAAQLNKMITAGLGGAVEAPETGVAVGRRVEYTSIGPAPILTFEANSELPLKAISVNMEPIQEGSGDPSPENIRPISGRQSVTVTRAGVNVWDEEWEIGNIDVNTGEPVASTLRLRSKNFITVAPNAQYYAAVDGVYTSGSWLLVLFYDSDKQMVAYVTPNKNTAFTTNAQAKYMKFVLSDAWGGVNYTGGISFNYPSSDTAYHAYEGQTVEVQLGQTVYGGTVDVVSGEMVVDRAYYKVTDSTELATDSAYTDFTRINFIVDGVRLSGKPNGAIISNIFKPGTLVKNGVFMHGTTGTINITPEISAGTTQAQIRAWLVANNAEICYELAQPVTITLTPEQLTTVLGTNNVWSDADEVSLTYGNIYYTEGY